MHLYYVFSVEYLLSPVGLQQRHLLPKGQGDLHLRAPQMTAGSLSYPVISVRFTGTSIASIPHSPAYLLSTEGGCVQITQTGSWYEPSCTLKANELII